MDQVRELAWVSGMNTRMCSQMQVLVFALSLLVLVSRVRTAPRTHLLAHLLQNEADGKEVRILSFVENKKITTFSLFHLAAFYYLYV